MGLTQQSTKIKSLEDIFNIEKKDDEFMIALAGNPNTGKSTVFNYLTGLKQHTGNWPGKTVCTARGDFSHKDINYSLIDLPGTYSLFPLSQEEIVARDFICFGNPDAVIVVCDSTCIERNLNLLFQVMELTDNVILCLNLLDEAKKKGIEINKSKLEEMLGIPVVLTAARSGYGMDELKETLNTVVHGNYKFNNKPVYYDDEIESMVNSIKDELYEIIPSINPRWLGLRLIDGDESILTSLNDYTENDILDDLNTIKSKLPDIFDKSKIRSHLSKTTYDYAKSISDQVVTVTNSKAFDRDEKIDRIVSSKIFGIPLMLLLLCGVLWLTIQGANYPSEIISNVLFAVEPKIYDLLNSMSFPIWLNEMITYGMYRTLAWVVSVMLPPMAIFFPLFTLLEDLGYLPRVAFNLDHLFKKACCHGKQCLTMCMGFGCNAAGVIGCRIIDSPRERLIAILTNNFVPCNGRFPTLIAISTIFFSSAIGSSFLSSTITALSITVLIIIGVLTTLLVSYILSKTLLKGVPSTLTCDMKYHLNRVKKLYGTNTISHVCYYYKITSCISSLFSFIIFSLMLRYISILSSKYITLSIAC